MGRKDIVTKDYMKDNEVFADAFNFLIYGGRQVIVPEKLHPMDSMQILMPYGAEGAEMPKQQYRDGLKYLAAMTDDTKAYLVLGNENQSMVHYAMPVRNMLYDAMQYAAQVEKVANAHRSAKDSQGHNAGEFLGGFYKEDRLIPVVTLVICFHGDKWDGPLCIYDMLELSDEEVRPFVENYRIHLIEPFSIEESRLGLFHSSLREVVSFLKYSKDREKLDMLLQKDTRFRSLDCKAAKIITECAGVEIEMPEKEGKVNMCKAIMDMKEKERAEGRVEGKVEGRREGAFAALSDLVRKGQLKPEIAAMQVQMSAEEFLLRMEEQKS